MATMQVLLRVAEKRPHSLTDVVSKVKQAAEANPTTLCLAAQVIAAVGKLSKVTFELFLKLEGAK